MRNNTSRNIDGILARRRSRSVWQKIVIALSCVVVFCTTYALILPAITLENTLICGKQAHEHNVECYQTEDPMVLICVQEAHTHSEECYAAPQNASPSAETTQNTSQSTETSQSTSSPTATTTPSGSLALSQYITSEKLFYRVSPNTDWTPVTSGITLPGNAELSLEISYQNVRVEDLRNAGLRMTYPLPQIMRPPTGSSDIVDDSKKKMGIMTIGDGVVTLDFDGTWLTNHHTSGKNLIDGDFSVLSPIDLSFAEDHPSPTIKVGNVDIQLNFEPDLIARYAEVKIQKGAPQAIQDGTGDYLEYTLTVTAGQFGARGVFVRDNLLDRSLDYFDSYVGIPTETPDGSNGGPLETGAPPEGNSGKLSMETSTNTMLWAIGNMNPNETRTLTYRVKLKDGYLGGAAPMDPGADLTDPEDDEPILMKNTAELFCKEDAPGSTEHRRGEASSNFTPRAEATMSKAAANSFTPDPDGSGGGTVTYTIWIQAAETNTYKLTNVKIWDALDGSITGGNNLATHSDYLQYISYKEDSFLLYPGGENGQNGTGGLTAPGKAVTPVFQINEDGTENKFYISCDVGTLEPGECKTLIYQVHVDPGAFPEAGSSAPRINNRAQIHAGDSGAGNEAPLNSFSVSTDVIWKEWSSKGSGEKQETSTNISIGDNVYSIGENGSLTKIDPPNPASFTASAGSYKYMVTVNEKGDWDVSRATLKDQLLGTYSSYIGYAQVDAYSVDASGNRTLTDTVWLSVAGLKSFSFTPTSIGLEGKKAYTLTYYTQVEVPSDYPVVKVENGFTMTGKVGIGDVFYDLNTTYVTASNTVLGTGRFAVSKHSWYYEPAKVSTGNYAHGTLYWYIQVDANVIPADTYLQDQTAYVPQHIYADSLEGIYIGNMGSETIAGYDDLNALLASGKLNRLDPSNYDTPVISSYKKNGRDFPTMTVHLKNSIQLEDGKSLFMIVRTEPSSDPADNTGTMHNTYKNDVKSSWDGNDWIDWIDANHLPAMVLYGSNGIDKTLEKVSAWNGTEDHVVIPADATPNPSSMAGLEKGTYISWKVQLNLPGRLHGDYYVEELIPQGLELAYVECAGIGSGYPNGAKPSVVQKTLDGWTECLRGSTHYYTNGQTARWYVEGLQTGGSNHTMDFRVVCRVTDGEVLQGGIEKTFENQVKLCREGGKVIDSSVSPVSLRFQSLKKEGLYVENSTSFPFKITLNPEGVDLVPGADTVSLEDIMSDTLKLDVSTIQVTKTGTDTEVTGWGSSIDGQKLTLTLPDQMPLTITYSAWINAEPNSTISISNNAHWVGYPQPAGSGVDNGNFEFTVQSSAGTSNPPSIKITKWDKNDLSKALNGAEYTLTAVEAQSDGTFRQKEGTEVWTGTTSTEVTEGTNGTESTDGVLTFGVVSDQTMEYNTIYCLRETKAPNGYVLDDTPHYFVIARKETKPDGSKDYPLFPANVVVHKAGSEYSYAAVNRKAQQITVQKAFSYLNGSPYHPVAGTYTFGLYDEVGSDGRPVTPPLETVSITYSNTDKENKTAAFTDLTLGKAYYVFELDGNMDPILNNGNDLAEHFTVIYSYPDGSDHITLTSENSSQEVTVTNKVHMPELPETGGIGTEAFYVFGWLLLAGASALLLTKKRPRRENP